MPSAFELNPSRGVARDIARSFPCAAALGGQAHALRRIGGRQVAIAPTPRTSETTMTAACRTEYAFDSAVATSDGRMRRPNASPRRSAIRPRGRRADFDQASDTRESAAIASARRAESPAIAAIAAIAAPACGAAPSPMGSTRRSRRARRSDRRRPPPSIPAVPPRSRRPGAPAPPAAARWPRAADSARRTAPAPTPRRPNRGARAAIANSPSAPQPAQHLHRLTTTRADR